MGTDRNLVKKISFRLCLIIQLSLTLNTLTAQNKGKSDSLLTLLDTGDFSKKEKIELLLDIAYYHPNPDSALLLSEESLNLAIELNTPILIAKSFEEIGINQGRLGNRRASLDNALRAISIYDSLNLIENQAASHNQIATSYMVEEDYSSAIKHLKQALSIYEESDKYGNKPFVNLNLGELYRLAGYLDSAKVVFKSILNSNFISKDNLKGYSLGNLGMIYYSQDTLKLAKTHLEEAVAILKNLGDSYATSVYLAELGEVYQKENSPKQAEEKFLEAMTMAQEAGLKEQIRDFSEKLTHFYEYHGDYNKALTYQKVFQVYQDSLVNKANIQEIEQLKARYEIDKRESEIGLLSRVNTNQKYLVWTLASGVLATLLFLYLLYRGNQRIKKANILLFQQNETIANREREKALLLKELNHRVKNNLQMISSLLNLQSRELEGHPAKEALETGKDRVEALSLVHRKLYQEGAETKIALREYVEELVLGLFYGYEAEFEPEFVIEEMDVSVDTAIPLALIINELVVNSLKYAYKEVTNPSFILKIERKDKYLILQAIDNGQGFILDKIGKKNSFGLKLMDSLIEQLEGNIKKLDGKGTHWWVQLKAA